MPTMATFGILNLICNNNLCNEKNNDLKTNRCDQLCKITEYSRNPNMFHIHMHGDIIKEVFLILEIDNDIYKNMNINSIVS